MEGTCTCRLEAAVLEAAYRTDALRAHACTRLPVSIPDYASMQRALVWVCHGGMRALSGETSDDGPPTLYMKTNINTTTDYVVIYKSN